MSGGVVANKDTVLLNLRRNLPRIIWHQRTDGKYKIDRRRGWRELKMPSLSGADLYLPCDSAEQQKQRQSKQCQKYLGQAGPLHLPSTKPGQAALDNSTMINRPSNSNISRSVMKALTASIAKVTVC